MVIAIVSDAIYPYSKGGKEVRSYNLAIRLVKMGHEVHFYCMKWWEGSNDRYENGLHLHAICKLYPMYKGERRAIKEGVLFGLSCFKLLRTSFDIIDVDHMPFFPLYSTRIVCAIKRKPMYATWHEVWGKKYWKEYMGTSGYFGYLMEKYSVRLSKNIIAVSDHTSSKLRANLKYKGKLTVIPAGIDFNMIKKIKPTKKTYEFIYAGRLIKHKNVDTLIKAISKLNKNGKTTKCLIVGEGPEREKLEGLSARLGVKNLVTFKKFVDKQEDLFAHMKASKVFVLPSSREGLGLTVIEASACGVPVIVNSTSNNAARFLIKPGINGFLFNGGVNSLSLSLEESLASARDLKSNCMNAARKFEWDRLAKDIDKVYSLQNS